MKSFPFSRLAAPVIALALVASVYSAEPAEMHHPTVNVIVAHKAPATAELLLPASLLASQDAPIYSRTTGYLGKWLVDIGDRVKAGQTLAIIESPEVDQQLNQSRAALVLAQANAALAKATSVRWQNLGAQNAVSQQDVEEKAAAAATGEASVKAAEADVARLTQLQSFETVTAPFDGVITARGADIGTLITTDASRPLLFRLAQQDPLRVYASIPQSYARNIRPGLDVEVLVSEFPGRVFHGQVTRASGALDPATRTLQTEVRIPNEQGELLPGMFGQLRFHLAPAEPPLLIPSNAPIIRADGNFVAVVGSGNVIHLQKVKFGRDFGSQLEIVDGLTDGATVVSNPSDALTDGLVVEPLLPDKKS